jgi:hypothetical protein
MGQSPEEAASAAGAGSETAHAWDTARRVREPIAWTLLVLTATLLITTAWQLFALPGAPSIAAPVASPPGQVPPAQVATFALRASAMAPNFASLGIVLLPVLSVILVAFTGGLTGRARQVVQTAISIQGVALGLGLLSWLAAFGSHTRPGIWFIIIAAELAITVAGLVFTIAVLGSPALDAPAASYQDYPEDEDDFEEQDLDLGDEGDDSGDDDKARS